jgi:D-tyrosyl-tRNA(Tyr) deacylase
VHGVQNVCPPTPAHSRFRVARGHRTPPTIMRVVLQRVSAASVTIDGRIAGRIGTGFCLLVGFTHDDTEAEVQWLAEKISGLRLFADDSGKMNLSLADVAGAVLIVSQFTLYGDTRKGRRPSFINAAHPDQATPLYQSFIEAFRAREIEVSTGEFGAMMDVDIHNDGPVTLVLERQHGA